MDTVSDVSLPNKTNIQSPQNSSNTTKNVLIAVIVFLVIVILIGIGIVFWQQSQIHTLKSQMQSEILVLKKQIDTIEAEKKQIERKTCQGVWKNETCVHSSCVDSDVNEKPNDIYIKGNVTVTDVNGVSTSVYDECSGSKQQVNEMWCYESPSGSGNYVQGKMVYECPNGCLDGACIK
jgi:hypothetical protein